MKIIRTVIILGAIGFLLPSPPDAPHPSAAASPEVAIAAYQAAGDVTGFCGRQPGVCSTAEALGTVLLAKLRYSIKLAYEWANGPEGAAGQPVSQAATTITPAADSPPSPAPAEIPAVVSQNTLREADILPQWRDPLALKRG